MDKGKGNMLWGLLKIRDSGICGEVLFDAESDAKTGQVLAH